MQIQDLPYPDPGVPDARSGPRFLWWLFRNQLGGQLKSLAWGLLHFASVSALPFCVGLAIQAVVDRSGTGLAVAGGLMVLCCAGNAIGDTFLHRAAVTNWITAAARVQQLLARKTALLGSALTRRVAAGEVVAVSTGEVVPPNRLIVYPGRDLDGPNPRVIDERNCVVRHRAEIRGDQIR